MYIWYCCGKGCSSLVNVYSLLYCTEIFFFFWRGQEGELNSTTTTVVETRGKEQLRCYAMLWGEGLQISHFVQHHVAE